MARILVTYATMAGATAEVARTIAEELAARGAEVDLLPIAEAGDLERYDGVILGAPMILGYHKGALRFLRKHRSVFRRIPLAVYALAMSLTETGTTAIDGVPVFVDPNLPKTRQRPDRLTYRERYATVSNYLRPVLRAVQPARPVRLAIFGGRLEYGRLKWWAVLFAMLIIKAQAGDRRNHPAIRAWAAGFKPDPKGPGPLGS
jgi:menaquinone-dependent protoporphyrinogen oxidase